MTGRPSRWGLVVCVAVVVSVLTGCAQKDDGVDKTLTIDQAKSQTQEVEMRIIELTPNGMVDRYMEYDDYITDEKVLALREQYYQK